MFEHCDHQNLFNVCSLVVHLPMWPLEVLICDGVITSTRTICSCRVSQMKFPTFKITLQIWSQKAQFRSFRNAEMCNYLAI